MCASTIAARRVQKPARRGRPLVFVFIVIKQGAGAGLIHRLALCRLPPSPCRPAEERKHGHLLPHPTLPHTQTDAIASVLFSIFIVHFRCSVQAQWHRPHRQERDAHHLEKRRSFTSLRLSNHYALRISLHHHYTHTHRATTTTASTAAAATTTRPASEQA